MLSLLLLTLSLVSCAPRINKWSKTDLTFSIDNRRSGMTDSDTKKAIHAAFELWSAVTPLTFKEVPSGGDIQFLFASGYHGDAYPFDGKGDDMGDHWENVLFHTFFPEIGAVHFDSDEPWTVDVEREMGKPERSKEDFLNAAIKSVGNALGLSSSITIQMNDKFVPRGTLTKDAIEAIQWIYGAPKN
ncbi:hypothetical protein PRIPAC_84135 [Pristionchus pacificus]|uniref:Peptidase n=1 Tax=Pristionchus pacificus TaxID=54126 RepID=A0A454XRB0_PRIPA|nr:hypothetical protein PRIPAC_84135 [Pristionchus pacificus]|eukprot:PDM69670.1 Peptidase [Pristionchus pacificus]